jgi:outer membrane protein OmpA-like peptidoglycan-associated protein
VPQLADTSPRASGERSGESESAGAPSQLASVPPASQPEVLDDGQLYRIPFGLTSPEISEAGQKHLDELAQRMKKDGALRLQLLGYAGSAEDSASKARRTSLFRALSVRTYLMKQGIRSTRMDVRALGNLAEGGAPDRVDAVIRK